MLANTHSSSPHVLCSRHYHLSQIVCLKQNVEGIFPQILCFEFCPQLNGAITTNSYETDFLYSPSSFSEQYILLLILFCCFPNHCGMKDLPRLKWVSHDLGPHLGLLLLYVTIRYRKWCLVIVIIDFIFRNYACISFLQCSINNLANSEGIST